MSFADSYMGQLRALVGNRRLLMITVRVLIEDDTGRILILKRADTGTWGLPAGAMELGDSVLDTIRREVREETNVDLGDVTVFGISSRPEIEDFTYPNGHQVQSVAVLAVARLPAGAIIRGEDGEAVEFRFIAPDAVPEDGFSPPEYPSFALLRRWRETGVFQLA
jgi:8-oxo-dGTP pyrophosphatase MutT (NUDIX family)